MKEKIPLPFQILLVFVIDSLFYMVCAGLLTGVIIFLDILARIL